MRIHHVLALIIAPVVVSGAAWVTRGVLAAGAPVALLPSGVVEDGRKTLAESKYTDVQGATVTLGNSKPTAMVFVFMNTECPISNKLVPELNRLAKLAADKKIEFYGVLSDPSVSRPEAQKHSKEYKIAFPMLFDASGTLAAALQPAVTPHAFVVDLHGKVIYSGRIDDSYAAVGKETGVTKTHDLQDAINATAAGRAAPKSTAAVGCIFESWKRTEKEAKVTWSRDIAPMVYADCTSCHHEGEVAPFSLMTYKDAAKRADMLAFVTEAHQMPPWKATDAWGTFHDERRLTAAQIELFQKWAAAGAPEGDKADAPKAPVYKNNDWELGKPDLVVKMAKPFKVPAAGKDIFAYSVVPLNIPADKYVVGFEYHPGNRQVVHHMIAFLDSTGAAAKLAKDKGDGATYLAFGSPGFTPTGGLGGWAPGATPRLLPDGVGHAVKKGSDLVLNLHYHPNGKAETDQGEIALYFAKKPVQQVSITFPLTNRQINIAPGDGNYIRTASITTPLDVTLEGITPHMHQVGREMKVTVTFPDGKTQQLIYVNDWDWNWQDQYQYSTPIKLPRGTKVELWARYDNSKENPRNPQNPPQRVTFGEQTSNEMCFAFLQLTVDGLRAPLFDTSGDDTLTPEQRVLQRLQQLRGNQGRGNP